MNATNPVPAYFTLRYVAWVFWSNALTIMSALQAAAGAFLALTDPDDPAPLLPHYVVRWGLVVNGVLGIFIAQFKRNNPPSGPPMGT